MNEHVENIKSWMQIILRKQALERHDKPRVDPSGESWTGFVNILHTRACDSQEITENQKTKPPKNQSFAFFAKTT